jgi:hypothetical protein
VAQPRRLLPQAQSLRRRAHQLTPTRALPRAVGGALVALALWAYYWIYFLPPRLLGGADPDRWYHLGLSRLMAAQGGLLRAMPQAEDIGWGRYFPDKEFLFHALTGSASALGGDSLVLWLVPVLGIAIALLLYLEASRVLRPWQATLLSVVALLGTSAFMYRLTLLRPHLLAVLMFCLLLLALLRARPRLAALFALLFALSYHAFYVVGVVAVACWLLRRQDGMPARAWCWVLGGLAAGLLANPYFPSNLEMGVFTLRLALGLATLPPMEASPELFQPTPGLLLSAYGLVFVGAVACAIGSWRRKLPAGAERTAFLFLLLVTAAFALMGLKTMRAMEYALPAALLLAAHAARQQLFGRHSLAVILVGLLALQGWLDVAVYRAWQAPTQSGYPEYSTLLGQVPRDSHAKVFNCEWETGSFILHDRPDLRFVDALDPTFLWFASPERYQARLGLLQGAFGDPHAILRGAFRADYVLCGRRGAKLIGQMDSRPDDFRSAPGSQGDAVRLFAVRPDPLPPPAINPASRK